MYIIILRTASLTVADWTESTLLIETSPPESAEQMFNASTLYRDQVERTAGKALKIKGA